MFKPLRVKQLVGQAVVTGLEVTDHSEDGLGDGAIRARFEVLNTIRIYIEVDLQLGWLQVTYDVMPLFEPYRNLFTVHFEGRDNAMRGKVGCSK